MPNEEVYIYINNPNSRTNLYLFKKILSKGWHDLNSILDNNPEREEAIRWVAAYAFRVGQHYKIKSVYSREVLISKEDLAINLTDPREFVRLFAGFLNSQNKNK